MGVALAMAIGGASAQTIQPQNREELQRIFGTGQNFLQERQGRASATLQPQNREELNRTFGTTLDLSRRIKMAATPATTGSLQQLALLTGPDPRSYLTGWHNIALDVTALDHAPTPSASPASFHEQFGPARTARALALVHLAMFEAANRLASAPYASLIYPESDPVPPSDANAAPAAITEAAFGVLAWLYPGLTDTKVPRAKPGTACFADSGFSLREYDVCALKEIRKAVGAASTEAGQALGREVAALVKKKFQNDGSSKPEPSWNADFVARTLPEKGDFQTTQWQIDPVSKLNIALGGHWADVAPIALAYGALHRPSEENSPARRYADKAIDQWDSYAALVAWAGEYRLNSPGLSDPRSTEKRDGFFVAQFWAYDATAGLCAPARLYNQIAEAVLRQLTSTPADVKPGSMDIGRVEDVARYYAIVNIAMNDAAIAAWDSKFYFQFARPVTAIRASQTGAKTLWYPVGAQVTNTEDGKNITPPFPAYPSGHASFGGALFGSLRQFVKDTETFSFMYRSDEFNGLNRDAYNYVRCGTPGKNPDGSEDGAYVKFCEDRKFTLDCAERENADSRIFMGVHWIIDADDGIELGNKVARDVFKAVLGRKGAAASAEKPLFSARSDKKRSDLRCENTDWPSGWEQKFGLTDFTPVEVR